MKIAILKNQKVTEIIEAELKVAKKLFTNIAPETANSGKARIGARFNGEKFEPQQPYASWVWNEEKFDYDPPIEKPKGIYIWDETAGDWVKHLPLYPSWTYNPDTKNYDPPKEYPDSDQPHTWDEATLDWVLVEPTNTEA